MYWFIFLNFFYFLYCNWPLVLPVSSDLSFFLELIGLGPETKASNLSLPGQNSGIGSAKIPKRCKNQWDWSDWSRGKKLYSMAQFTCFTIGNWESWFLKFFSRNMTLRLHRHYLHHFNDQGTPIPSRRREEVYVVAAVTSELLGARCSLPFPGLWLWRMHILPFDLCLI